MIAFLKPKHSNVTIRCECKQITCEFDSSIRLVYATQVEMQHMLAMFKQYSVKHIPIFVESAFIVSNIESIDIVM